MPPLIFYKDRAIRGRGIGLPTAPFPGRDPELDPRELGNIALWLDATRITGLNDGDAVATWADLSGNGRDATQGTAANRPLYKVGVQNGQPVVRFDGTSDALQLAAYDLSGTSGVTVYAVVKSSGGAGSRVIYEFSTNLTLVTTGFGVFRFSASNVLYAVMKGDVGTPDFTSSAPALTSTFKQISAVFDKSLATNEVSGWVNGNGAGSRIQANNTGAFGNLASFVGARGGTSLFFDGDMGELLVYSRAHTVSQRQQIEGYLRRKWGLS